MPKPLYSLTLPILSGTLTTDTTYSLLQNYIYDVQNNSTDNANSTLCAVFDSNDINFIGIIQLLFNGESCSVLYDRSQNCAQVLSGSISNSSLKFFEPTEGETILAFINDTTGPSTLRVTIMGGYSISSPNRLQLNTEENCLLSLPLNVTTIYAGIGGPSTGIGKPGDIYIQIKSSQTVQEGEAQ